MQLRTTSCFNVRGFVINNTATTTFVSAYVLTRIDYRKSLFFESNLDPKALDIGAKLLYFSTEVRVQSSAVLICCVHKQDNICII